jgi:hypothetical protein
MRSPPRADGVPSVGDVVAHFRRALGEEAREASNDTLGLLLALHRNNVDQWRREDVTRRPDADDATVAAAKRDIDKLNATRHGLVEAIDAALVAAIEQEPSATPTTESPGMVFDRLSVLTIRVHFTERAARDTSADGDGYAVRLPVLQQHLTDLQEALEGLFDDVRTGRKRFVPYQSLKLYGSRVQAHERTPS